MNNREQIRYSSPYSAYPNQYRSAGRYADVQTIVQMYEAQRVKSQTLVLELERMNELLRERDAKIEELEAELRKERRKNCMSMMGKPPETVPVLNPVSKSAIMTQNKQRKMSGYLSPSFSSSPKYPVAPATKQISEVMNQQSMSTVLTQSATDTSQHTPNLRERMELHRDVQPNVNFYRQSKAEVNVNASLQTIILGPPNTNNLPAVGFKLFETFLIVSTDQVSEFKNNSYSLVKPSILLRYPTTLDSQQAEVIPIFCFPKGVSTRQISGQQEAAKQNVNRLSILASTSFETSIFCLRSDLTNSLPQRIYNEVLEAINPSYRLFGICFKCNGVAKSATQDIYYEVPKAYVFLTYFPFISFFINALSLIVNTLRSEEAASLPNMPTADNIVLVKYLQNMMKQVISSLSVNLRFKFLEVFLPLAIPDQNHIDQLVLSYCLSCVSKIEAYVLAQMLTYILLEQFLLVHSSSSTLLSQIMLLLLCIIRPLKYPFVVIPNLPFEMKYLIESPFPALIGTTLSDEIWLNEVDLTNSTSKSVYFDLDKQQIKRKPQLPDASEFILNLKAALARIKIKQQIDIFKRLRYAVVKEILEPISEGKLTNFHRRFQKSAIYKLYVDSNK